MNNPVRPPPGHKPAGVQQKTATQAQAQPPAPTAAPAQNATTGIQVPNEQKLPALVGKMADAVDMLPQQYFNTVMATVGLGRATYAQQIAFLLTAKKYDLDPMVKQISAFEKGGKVFPMVQIDGWLRIINDHPEMEGMEFEDTFNEDGTCFSITCKIWRKGRRVPVSITEYMSECVIPTSEPWKKWPIRMLRHKTTIQAGRYAFSLGGIYDPDEIERIKQQATTPADIVAGVQAHMDNVAAPQPQAQDAEYSQIDPDEGNGQASTIPAAGPIDNGTEDWTAIYDELAPGVMQTKNPAQLQDFVNENSSLIESMGMRAPAAIVNKWVNLVHAQEAGFQKKG